MARKKRTEIPKEIAARVLFLSDRTCCVCRVYGKPVQIHHIDEDPSNHESDNLAVLCLDCHRDTQIRGGFDRKLDSDQVVLYREDWHRLVMQQRATAETRHDGQALEAQAQLELSTSIAETLRENGQYSILAGHYDLVGNAKLRDKYIELAIANGAGDRHIWFLRSLQDKPDLIPAEVVERELKRWTDAQSWTQVGRLLVTLHRYREAAESYIKGIARSLEEGNTFSAAFYLKELVEQNLIDELFVTALKDAADEEGIWWQVRSLQELGWSKELDELILENAEEIEEAGNPDMLLLLASAQRDDQEYIRLRRETVAGLAEARSTIPRPKRRLSS